MAFSIGLKLIKKRKKKFIFNSNTILYCSWIIVLLFAAAQFRCYLLLERRLVIGKCWGRVHGPHQQGKGRNHNGGKSTLGRKHSRCGAPPSAVFSGRKFAQDFWPIAIAVVHDSSSTSRYSHSSTAFSARKAMNDAIAHFFPIATLAVVYFLGTLLAVFFFSFKCACFFPLAVKIGRYKITKTSWK